MGEGDSPEVKGVQKTVLPPQDTDTLKALNHKDKKEDKIDKKEEIIIQLKRISLIVAETNKEQLRAESNQFTTRAQNLIKLGDGYIAWLETHRDEVPDDKTFQAVASLAKSSLLLNLEQYVRTVREIGAFVKAHPDLDELNPPGKKDGPWAGIKEVLYYTTFNDTREEFRESILQKTQLLIIAGELTPRQLDHLERFLVDPQKRAPNQFIPEYVSQNAVDIQQWAPLSLEDFKAYIVTKLGNYKGDLSQNALLRQMDEEIASIKPENLQAVDATKKTKYMDRQTKLAFIRDLRFSRENLDAIKSKIAVERNEITNIPTLNRDLAPRLRKHWKGFQQELQATVGQDPQLRRQALIVLASSYGLQSQDLQFVLEYLENNIK